MNTPLSCRGLACLCAACLALGHAPSVLAAAHTPEPGSAERKAICDAMREHLIKKVATRKLPQPIVFKVDYMRVDRGFAWFEGIPVLKSGGFVPPEILPDVGYMMVLQGGGTSWKVIHDLSRSDVPSDGEAKQLRSELRDVPSSILPEFWRKLLNR